MNAQKLSDLSDAELIKAHLQAADTNAAKNMLAATEAGRVILEADADRRASLAAAGIDFAINERYYDPARITSLLLRADQKSWTPPRLARVVEAAAKLNRTDPSFAGFDRFPHKPLITAIEKAAEREGLSEELRAALERWKAAIMPRELTPQEERALGEAERDMLGDIETTPYAVISKACDTITRLTRIRTPLADERRLIERLSVLLSAVDKQNAGTKGPMVRIDATDAVGARVAADVAKGGRASGKAWAELLLHARGLTATKPAPRWSEEAARMVANLNAKKFGECVSDWFNEAGKAAAQKLVNYRDIFDATLLNDCSVELLKGLAWAVVAARRSDLAPALGNLADVCCKKVPNIGPRNVKVGNAAIAALAALEDPQAAAHLSRLRLRVRHPSSRSKVDGAFAKLSEKTGIPPEDLAEMSVPTFELDAKGNRRVKLGACVGEMRVASSQKVELRWTDEKGKDCDSAPAVLRKEFAEDLKRLQREAKDASAMVAAQALRLERSYLNDRSWSLVDWKKRFLEHPLVGTLARRLIWKFDDTTAIPHEGELVTTKDQSFKPDKDVVVSLWHPIQSKPAEVAAWREWLVRHEVTQPFKQAHREIYALTDAERRTESYSNRFAGHILRQHPFGAVCQHRGWNYWLQGDFDSHCTPTLKIPAHNLSAEYWVEGVENELSPQGIFLYVASDQVRIGESLVSVPPVVFSEVMRDVDLFVSVASVANDPTWRDQGPAGRLRTYWDNWSFGELSESARTRKDILEKLLPRLAENHRFSLKDKFLVVQGQLRTYKIHLGSGNILMEPNDQYLCIVPDRGSASAKHRPSLFLPFEGDMTLSVILSKALMLAGDDKIKDETISRQIKS